MSVRSLIPITFLLLGMIYPAWTEENDSITFITEAEKAKREQILTDLRDVKRELEDRVSRLEDANAKLTKERDALQKAATALLDALGLVTTNSVRAWTAANGKHVMAKVGEFTGDSVELISPDGKSITVQRHQLSLNDQDVLSAIETVREHAEAVRGPPPPPTFGAVGIVKEPVAE